MKNNKSMTTSIIISQGTLGWWWRIILRGLDLLCDDD
jgi:hypothetical protein